MNVVNAPAFWPSWGFDCYLDLLRREPLNIDGEKNAIGVYSGVARQFKVTATAGFVSVLFNRKAQVRSGHRRCCHPQQLLLQLLPPPLPLLLLRLPLLLPPLLLLWQLLLLLLQPLLPPLLVQKLVPPPLQFAAAAACNPTTEVATPTPTTPPYHLSRRPPLLLTLLPQPGQEREQETEIERGHWMGPNQTQTL